MIAALLASKAGRLAIGGLLVLLLIGAAVGYGRFQRARALRAEAALAQALQVQASLQAALTEQTAAVGRLRREGEAMAQRVAAGAASAAQVRSQGEARVQQILLKEAPVNDEALARWAAQEARSLPTRLEEP